MQQKRKLAAILFTDIVGYTALMQQDEDKTVKIRERHREIFAATTVKFNGSFKDKSISEAITFRCSLGGDD